MTRGDNTVERSAFTHREMYYRSRALQAAIPTRASRFAVMSALRIVAISCFLAVFRINGTLLVERLPSQGEATTQARSEERNRLG